MSCAIFAPRRVPLSNGGEASLRARARFPGERKDGALEPMAVSRPAWACSAHNLGPALVLGASGAACASAALALLRPLLYQSPCPRAPPEIMSGGPLHHKLPTSNPGAKRERKMTPLGGRSASEFQNKHPVPVSDKITRAPPKRARSGALAEPAPERFYHLHRILRRVRGKLFLGKV